MVLSFCVFHPHEEWRVGKYYKYVPSFHFMECDLNQNPVLHREKCANCGEKDTMYDKNDPEDPRNVPKDGSEGDIKARREYMKGWILADNDKAKKLTQEYSAKKAKAAPLDEESSSPNDAEVDDEGSETTESAEGIEGSENDAEINSNDDDDDDDAV
jgi:hypothetical protein